MPHGRWNVAGHVGGDGRSSIASLLRVRCGLCVLLPPPPTTTTTATAEQEAEEDNDESDDEESANRKRLRKQRTMTVVGCGNDCHRMCRECLTKQVFEAALRERRVACYPPCVEWGCTATLYSSMRCSNRKTFCAKCFVLYEDVLGGSCEESTATINATRRI